MNTPTNPTKTVTDTGPATKMCHLSAMLVKATHFGPTGFLHYFLKYMELTKKDTNILTKLNAQQLEKLGNDLQRNKTGIGMGNTNDKGLGILLTNYGKDITKFFFGKYDDLKREKKDEKEEKKLQEEKKIVESGDHITYYMIEYNGTIYISFHPKIWNNKKNTDKVTGFPRDYTSWVSNERWEGQFLNLANTLFRGAKKASEYEDDGKKTSMISVIMNDSIQYQKKVDKSDINKPHIIVGYQCSGPISEIVGIRLKTEFEKKDVTVVNWSSPSWFNDDWAKKHTITGSSKLPNESQSIFNKWQNVKTNNTFKLFKFRSVGDLFPEMPRFFNSPGSRYTKPMVGSSYVIDTNKCKDTTGKKVQLKTAWQSEVSIVPGYKQLGDGENKLTDDGDVLVSRPQPVANSYTYFVKTDNGKLSVIKVDGTNEGIQCNQRNRLNTFKLGFIKIPNINGSQTGQYYDQWKIREKIFKQIYNLKGLEKNPDEGSSYDINHNLTDQATHEIQDSDKTLKKKEEDSNLANLAKGKKIVLTVVPGTTTGGRRKTRKRRKRKGGRRKTRKNKRKTRRRKSKKRRRRTRRRKRR